MLLQGLFVPLSTPFYRDGESYPRKLEHNVRRYSLSPAAGLVALPPAGEATSLTDAEAAESLRAVAESAARQKVLVAGVQRASVRAALGLIQVAYDAGFDAALLAPPTDWARLVHQGDARELLLFYRSVADASPLPVVLWSDVPPALQLPVSAIGALAQHGNIYGLIDAGLTTERLQELLAATAAVRFDLTVTPIFEAVTRRMLAEEPPVPASTGFVAIESLSTGPGAVAVAAPALAPAVPALKTRTRSVGFQVLSAGPAFGDLALLQGGAVGLMPPMAACAPQGVFEVYAAWKDGDAALAAERAARLETAERLLAELGVAGVKYGCDWNGYFGGLPRLPQLPLTAEQKRAVEKALGEIRN